MYMDINYMSTRMSHACVRHLSHEHHMHMKLCQTHGACHIAMPSLLPVAVRVHRHPHQQLLYHMCAAVGMACVALFEALWCGR